MRLSALHHITLIESGNTNCAWVRIKCEASNFQQSFALKKYGGKAKAIAAAKLVRDAKGNELYGNHWPYSKFSPRTVSPLNSSGEIGVSFSGKDNSWVATWQEGKKSNRKQRNAYFSINKYGSEKARKLAIKTRRQKILANRVE